MLVELRKAASERVEQLWSLEVTAGLGTDAGPGL